MHFSYTYKNVFKIKINSHLILAARVSNQMPWLAVLTWLRTLMKSQKDFLHYLKRLHIQFL